VIPETFDYLCGQSQCCGETGPTGLLAGARAEVGR
jgi:hypothetical protein